MGDPSERIVEAATRHFADRGFEDASVRAIALDAGVNAALINYYFRSKEELYQTVVVASVARLSDARVARLDALERAAGPVPLEVRVVLAATVGPVFEDSKAPDTDRRAYIRFLSRLFTHPGPETVAVVFGALAPLRSRVLSALHRSLPHLSHEELSWRYLFLSGSVQFTVSQIGYIEVISDGACESAELDTALVMFIAAQTAMLSAPAATARDRRLARQFAKPAARRVQRRPGRPPTQR